MMVNDDRNASQDFNYGHLINQLNPNTRKLVRKLEKLNKKLINNEYGILFNKTCIYLYIYIRKHYA